MKITKIHSVPISFRVPENNNVRLGIGRAVKRDAVLVKVETSEGIVGWGEAHHGRCPGAIAKLIDTTISELAVGMGACETVDVWDKIYRMQLASHGMGYASVMALSGLDLALWDIRAKSVDLPLYRPSSMPDFLGNSVSPKLGIEHLYYVLEIHRYAISLVSMLCGVRLMTKSKLWLMPTRVIP